MKKNRLLFLLPFIASFALTSCDLLSNLMPTSPSRRSSKEKSSEVFDDSNDITSSYSSSSRSSTHKHNWGEWVVVEAATCTAQGRQERECVECHQIQTAYIPMLDHDFSIKYTQVEPSCVDAGLETWECSRCGERKYDIVVPALGHEFAVDQNGEQIVNWSQAPTCTQSGIGTAHCLRCSQNVEIHVDPFGHDITLIGGTTTPAAGEAAVRLYKCKRCEETFLPFGVDQVSAASSQHLVDGEYGGKRFWGRPIGNAMAIDEQGTSINQYNDEIVYCSTETGDFFEYVFTLNAEQAAVLSTCRLYCDAKPANYLNGTDFFAYGRSNDEWTPGYYIDGSDAHVQHNTDGSVKMVKDHARPAVGINGAGVEGVEINRTVPMGARVADYRYVLYVDGAVQEFDPLTENPTHGNNTNMQREEFVVPYTFHLHEGQNKFSLHMAGGYRSEFFSFYFKPYVEPTPVQVDQESITVREGKTVQITSSMSGLTFTSAKTSIATVSNTGLVTGVQAGTTTITVSKEGNYRKTVIPVTVLEPEGVVSLNLTDGVIAPAEGLTVYTSGSSGTWYREWKKDTAVTYTFQSELAGKFDIRLGLRGSSIVLADNFTIKVNGVDVALTGTVSTAYSAVEYIVGQADLVVGENTMVITALQDNSLYLKTLKLIPHQYVAFQTWGIEELEANRTDSGWEATKQFGDNKAFKFNKAGSITLSYTFESAQKVMLQLRIGVKQSNNAKTGFWEQDGTEKTRITVNGVAVTSGAEPDFTGSVSSNVSDNGNISTIEWYNIIEIDLVAGANTISIEYLNGGYCYYIGGIALAR